MDLHRAVGLRPERDLSLRSGAIAYCIAVAAVHLQDDLGDPNGEPMGSFRIMFVSDLAVCCPEDVSMAVSSVAVSSACSWYSDSGNF